MKRHSTTNRTRIFRYYAIRKTDSALDSYQCQMGVSAETSEGEAIEMARLRNPKFEIQSDGFQI